MREHPFTAITAIAGVLVTIAIWAFSTATPKQPGILPAPTAAGAKDLPNFSAIKDTGERKEAFFAYLRPIIEAENRRILTERRALTRLRSQLNQGRELSSSQAQYLRNMAMRYRVDLPADEGEPLRRPQAQSVVNQLLVRVDIVPASLALIQAAKESAWGTSRFAQQGNNLFGQWCYERGCGIVPARRRAGASHEVQRFPTVRAAVVAYIHNLNVHRAYKGLRQRRAELRRSASQELSGITLARGLSRYSEQGQSYVNGVVSMIRENKLEN